MALVTVSYGSGGVLPQMLRSIAGASSSRLVGVIADNNPQPEVAEIAESAGYTYLAFANVGYGAAVNAAVSALPPGVKWVVITNPDVVFNPHSIDSMLRTANSDERIGSVGPRILDENGHIYPSARLIPSLRNGVGHAVFGSIWHSNPWTRRYFQSDLLSSSDIREAGWLSGACLLVRKSAFLSIGGFDESYFMYFEDVDLGLRMGKAGFVNMHDPLAEIVHTGAHSTEVESDRMISAHHASAQLFLSRRYPGALLAPVRAFLGLGLMIRLNLKRSIEKK